MVGGWRSIDVKLINRAGKVGGKYKNCWNVEDSDSGHKYYVDFDKVNWTPNNTPEQQNTPETECDQLNNMNSSEGGRDMPEDCMISRDIRQSQKEALYRAKIDETTMLEV